MALDDPILHQQEPLETKKFREMVPNRHRTAGHVTTQMFVDRVTELQMKGLICDPIQVLMEIASGRVLNDNGTITMMEPPPEPSIRQKAAAELCSYIFPKRKAVELSSDPEKPITFLVLPDQTPLPGSKDVVVLNGHQSNQLVGQMAEDEEDEL